MKKQDYAWIGGLAATALWIWARDRAWAECAGDTLPILAGMALLVWLPWPWTWRDQRSEPSPRLWGAALGVGLVGILLDSTAVLALSWVLLLASWISSAVASVHRESLGKLLVLPFLAFPWMVNDFSGLGWSFRLSAAAATERILAGSFFQVAREGTFLTVNGFALSVEPACSGLNGLQAMLTAGAALAFIRLQRTWLFWPALLMLPAAAWVANLLRILFAAVAGSRLSPEAARRWIGPLHLVAGWLAIALMFALCSALYAALARHSDRIESSIERLRARLPVLEIGLAGYAACESQSALRAWFHAPFERLAWLAFAIWLAPVLARRGWRMQAPWLAGAGIAALMAGQLGDLNLLRQVGLGLVLGAIAPTRRRLAWTMASISWLSALGWLGSELAVSPVAICLLRLALAGAAAGAELKRSPSPDAELIPFAYDRVK